MLFVHKWKFFIEYLNIAHNERIFSFTDFSVSHLLEFKSASYIQQYFLDIGIGHLKETGM